jgi:site-specific recombinase XerD
MSTSLVLSLDTRKKKQDTTYPIVLRITHNGLMRAISTGFSVKESEWNPETRTVRKSYKGVSSVSRLNNILSKRKSDALDTIMKLESEGVLSSMTVQQIKERISGSKDEQDFYSFTATNIEQLIEQGRIGTARSYRDTIASLKKYFPKKRLTFSDITYDFLNLYETKYRAQGHSANGLAVYMRTIRAIYNKAVKGGLIEKKHYPFNDYTIKTKPTRKRAIALNDMKRLLNLELEPDSALRFAQELFTVSFYLMGMNITDIFHLKLKNLKNGRIAYARAKTAHLYDILVPEAIAPILKKYSEGKSEDEYLFPIIKRNSQANRYRDIEWARSRYNKRLKELARLAEISATITSYTTRHTYATLCKQKGIPLGAIQEMLGHQSIKTTQVYLDSLSSDTRDAYHKEAINFD